MDLQSILSKTAGRRQRLDDEGTRVPASPHVATEERPYDHDQSIVPDVAPPTVAKADQRESEPPTKGINHPNKGNQRESTKGIKADQRESKGINHPIKGNQEPLDSLCDPSRFPLIPPLIPFDPSHKGNQEPLDSLCDPSRFPLPAPPTHTLKGNQTAPVPRALPTSPQQRQILGHLARGQADSGLGHTPRIQRKALAQHLGTTPKTVKLQLQRLARSGHLQRVSVRHGRGQSGTVYAVPSALLPLLEHDPKGNQTGTSNTANKGNQQRESSARSSSYITTTTDNPTAIDRTIAQQLQQLVARFNLDDQLKIGSNDLLAIWRNGPFPTFDDFAQSIEHLAFYLGSDQARGIEHPKAWMMKQLRNGYYAEPAGFISWDEQVAAAKLKASQDKLRRLRALELEQFDTDFEVWFLERTDAERRDMLQGSFFAQTPNSHAARAVLRQRFCELTNRINPHGQHDESHDDPSQPR